MFGVSAGYPDIYMQMALGLRDMSELNDCNLRPCPEVKTAIQSPPSKKCVIRMAMMQSLLVSKDRMKSIREMCGISDHDLMRAYV